MDFYNHSRTLQFIIWTVIINTYRVRNPACKEPILKSQKITSPMKIKMESNFQYSLSMASYQYL